MHLTEANMISCRSEYFLYSATPKMRNCMYYPHRVGLGDFMPGYRLSRTPMNNFLIAYISEGSFRIRFADVDAIAHEGQFLIVDCYEPHRFSTDESCRDIWLHYDGPAARNMYEYIVERSGNIIDAGRSGHGLHEMHAIFDMLKAGRGAREAELSHHIDGMLASLASAGKSSGPHSDALNVIDRSLPYITAHLNDDLSLDSLATVFCIDKYYFSKRFKERTGTTPHQYILNARLERGKFLLHTTTLPVGAISADCGFHSQSMFCAAFKRANGKSPSQYRAELSQPFQS